MIEIIGTLSIDRTYAIPLAPSTMASIGVSVPKACTMVPFTEICVDDEFSEAI